MRFTEFTRQLCMHRFKGVDDYAAHKKNGKLQDENINRNIFYRIFIWFEKEEEGKKHKKKNYYLRKKEKYVTSVHIEISTNLYQMMELEQVEITDETV